MPFFHDQDRNGLRRYYLEAWRKQREAAPLTPLEAIAALRNAIYDCPLEGVTRLTD